MISWHWQWTITPHCYVNIVLLSAIYTLALTQLLRPPPPPKYKYIYIFVYGGSICTIGNLVVVFKLQIGLYYSCQYLYVIIMCSFYMCRVFLLVPGSRWCHIWRDFCLASCGLSGSQGSPHCGRHPFFGRLVDHLPLYCGLHPVLLLCLALYRKSLDWIFCRLECVLCIGKPLSSLYAVEVVHIIW